MKLEKEIAFFDKFESEHGEYDVLKEDSYNKIITIFEKCLDPKSGMSFLDMGCGTGAFSKRLSRFKFSLAGIDISPSSIKRANALGIGKFIVGDICHCPLPSFSFDIIAMSGVLHHIDCSEDRLASLREAYRLLIPGGKFFSYDPNAYSPSMFLYRNPYSPFYSRNGKTDNEILFNRNQLGKELSVAGFKNIKILGLSGISYQYVEGRIARKLLPLYNYVYEPLIHYSGLENIFGTFLIATAEKT